MGTVPSPIQLNDVDRDIWTNELDSFVPQNIFDVHTHCYRWEFNSDPDKETGPYAELFKPTLRQAGRAELELHDQALLPGRRVHRLSFGFPWPSCDFDASNRFVAEQASYDTESAGLLLVHPSMAPLFVEEQIRAYGFLGLKPYRVYSRSGDWNMCSITDFLPEEQLEIAQQFGSLVMLHLSKRDAIADEGNINDLVRLALKYSNVKWVLAHCGRSYAAWPIERAAPRLCGLPNIWFDVSSVCESEPISALLKHFGQDRVMYGSDDLPVGVLRGKYVTFGYAWAFLSENNHSLDLSHCRNGMTYVRYEQLRAMRRAAIELGLSSLQIEDLFFNTAHRLVTLARKNLTRVASDEIIRRDAPHLHHRRPTDRVSSVAK